MLLKLIPSDLVLDYNKLQQKDSGSDIQQLLSFLTQSLTARELTYSTNKSSFELCNHRQETKSNFSREPSSYKQQNQKSFHIASELLTAPVKENKDKIKFICIFCDSMTHNSNECEYVINMSLEERKNILLRKGPCFNCLKIAKHLSRNCPIKKTKCEICSVSHHKFFCFKQLKRKIGSTSTDLANQNTEEVLLQTLAVFIENGNSKQLVRAILDTGSQKSYISEYDAKFISLKSIGKETITHGIFVGHKMTEVRNKYLINLRSYDQKYCFIMEVNDQKNICLGISRINDSRVLQKLATHNIFISDSSANNKLCLFEKHSDEIHILLGSDIVGKLFTGEVKQLSERLTAVNTRLGWTVTGKISCGSKFKLDNSLLVHSLFTNREKISDLWELDSLGIKDPSEKKSKLELQDLALKHFENTVLRDDEGRLFDYEQVFVDWEKEGIIEKIAQDEPKNGGKFHYLPQRSVFKENSTTEIRPVFDGSAHHGKSCSLNDCIEKGPNLIEMIPAILNCFRLGKIGVISDIRKAFLQISLHENDMNFLPFLWWEGGNSEKAVIYRHRRVVFEVSCSPFLLAAVLNHHFKQAPEQLEKAAEKLIDSMFVDNCVASVDSSEELESFQRDSTELSALGKFDLHGWRHSDIESNFDFQDNQQKSDPEEILVLRLMWNLKEDTFSISYRETESKEEITKRRILSLAHR
ncbi:integrase catalytic domain-containing protein [Trichonephila clavipes]|nr:integrase catalytic domain-containing protein [Trichonephila clavipes]